eukprot:5162898-Prymnesium_polylepis.1
MPVSILATGICLAAVHRKAYLRPVTMWHSRVKRHTQLQPQQCSSGDAPVCGRRGLLGLDRKRRSHCP